MSSDESSFCFFACSEAVLDQTGPTPVQEEEGSCRNCRILMKLMKHLERLTCTCRHEEGAAKEGDTAKEGKLDAWFRDFLLHWGSCLN